MCNKYEVDSSTFFLSSKSLYLKHRHDPTVIFIFDKHSYPWSVLFVTWIMLLIKNSVFSCFSFRHYLPCVSSCPSCRLQEWIRVWCSSVAQGLPAVASRFIFWRLFDGWMNDGNVVTFHSGRRVPVCQRCRGCLGWTRSWTRWTVHTSNPSQLVTRYHHQKIALFAYIGCSYNFFLSGL